MKSPSNNKDGMSKGQAFWEEWKKRRQEDEEKFLKLISDPEHRKQMEALKGKIVIDGKTVSAS